MLAGSLLGMFCHVIARIILLIDY